MGMNGREMFFCPQMLGHCVPVSLCSVAQMGADDMKLRVGSESDGGV